MTVLAYFLTIGLSTFRITSVVGLPIFWLISRFYARLGAGDLGVLIGALAGHFLGWVALNWAWRLVEGGLIPIAALGISFMVMGLHDLTAGEDLNPMARRMVGADMWAIVLLATLLVLEPGPVRWL